MIMEKSLLIVLCILVGLLYLKWALILILFPLQVLYANYQNDKSNFLKKIFASPYWVLEHFVFRHGWSRYMLFQVSTIPSNHFRKLIYKALGAHIGPKVVFHFQTEIRSVNRLFVGGGLL